jgi:hypothetical protein
VAGEAGGLCSGLGGPAPKGMRTNRWQAAANSNARMARWRAMRHGNHVRGTASRRWVLGWESLDDWGHM